MLAVGKLSREEFRRQKDLDAARKAGTAPAALDEEGKPINPHIPRMLRQECHQPGPRMESEQNSRWSRPRRARKGTGREGALKTFNLPPSNTVGDALAPLHPR